LVSRAEDWKWSSLPGYPMFGVKPTEADLPARESPLFSGLLRVVGPLAARKL
jgi:hypothetical protein